MTDAERAAIEACCDNATGPREQVLADHCRALLAENAELVAEVDRLRAEMQKRRQYCETVIAERDQLKAEVEKRGELLVNAGRNMVALEKENERLRTRLLSAAGDDLCRLTQDEIKAYTSGAVKIPPKEEFIPSCERFHAQIANESGVLTNCLTLAQMIAENERLRQRVAALEVARSSICTTAARQEALARTGNDSDRVMYRYAAGLLLNAAALLAATTPPTDETDVGAMLACEPPKPGEVK